MTRSKNRRTKQLKAARAKANNAKAARRAEAKTRAMESNASEGLGPGEAFNLSRLTENPYESEDALVADIQMMEEAVKRQYGDVPEGFHPPILDMKNGGEEPSDWVIDFRDRLIEKYQSSEIAERKMNYQFLQLMEEAMKANGDIFNGE